MSILAEQVKILTEAPLPDDWDHSVFAPRTSFAAKINYAKQQAQKVGAGSSRIAFIIDYQGRKTVLKIAKNGKGLAQNRVEAAQLSDGYYSRIGILIPLIDYDERNPQPTWIHTEFARKATVEDFKRACGGTPGDLVAYTEQTIHGKYYSSFGYAHKVDPDAEIVADFHDYIAASNVLIGDFSRTANWGVYNGRLVIIDAGFDKETFYTHYRG